MGFDLKMFLEHLYKIGILNHISDIKHHLGLPPSQFLILVTRLDERLTKVTKENEKLRNFLEGLIELRDTDFDCNICSNFDGDSCSAGSNELQCYQATALRLLDEIDTSNKPESTLNNYTKQVL